MRTLRFGRWSPVVLGTLVTAALLGLSFWPSHERAVTKSKAALKAERVVGANVAALQSVPLRKRALDSLIRELGTFRAGLLRSDQVDRVMHDFEERARKMDVQCWVLNPSVPTLVALEQSPDSVAALDLVQLPVEFECVGDFLAVGRFLESEEQRSQFCQWRRLTITSGSRIQEVRAHAEVVLFLLPADHAGPEDGEAS